MDDGKYILNMGCIYHGRLSSYDAESEFFDTYDQAYQAYVGYKETWKRLGYCVTFANIIEPSGTNHNLMDGSVHEEENG